MSIKRLAKKAPAASRQAARVLAALEEQIPEPHCELDHQNAWQLLVATILSAQSTDRTVNKVTPALFAKYPTPRALASATQEDVERLVHATGFFRNKAKSIIETARAIDLQHGGEVPRSMEPLLLLRGVARKTANVVLGTAYRIPSGIAVDVHVTRVSQRLGLTTETAPETIELALQALYQKDAWIDLGHRLVLHGRYTCLARSPKCDACACESFCPSSVLRTPKSAPKAAKRATKKPKR